MKPLLILTLGIVLGISTMAMAGDFESKVKFPQSAVNVEDSSPRMAVKFNHSTHKDIACDTCHHKPRCAICHYAPGEEKSSYASCSANAECHAISGKSRDPKSQFMAFHARDSKRSCFGCHRSLADSHPEFQGCRPCHSSTPPNAQK